MPERPLSPTMVEALRAYLTRGPLSGNELGYAVDARHVEGGRGMNGRGKGHRNFGRAQAVIPVITNLRRRGLIAMSTNYRDEITAAGRRALAELDGA